MLYRLILIILLLGAFFFYEDYQKFIKSPIHINEEKVFLIDRGETFTDIQQRLLDQNIIKNKTYFHIVARQNNKLHKLKYGEYHLTPDMNPVQLLDLFISGKVIQYAFTIIEGWRIADVLNAMDASDLFVHTLSKIKPDRLAQELGLPEPSAEGLLFSDTYYLTKGTTDRDFLRRAYQKLQTVLNEEWQQRADNLPYLSPYEALIMASIIEKETALASERKKIAGVFVRRLNKNMKLQTDPTVIYAMQQNFNGNITKKDLNIDSPYNTYRYRGLPPGPIALVGQDAIHAALHPEENENFLYFVAKGDGSHHFSNTLAEHNQAVAKYQLNR